MSVNTSAVEETLPTSGGDSRITPQELTSALRAIEARQAAAMSRVAETITVEDAVAHLGLDVTPQEILAEVDAQRRRKTRAVSPWRRLALRVRSSLIGLALALSLAANIGLTYYVLKTRPGTPYQRVLAALPENRPVYASLDAIRSLAAGQVSGRFTLEGVEKPAFALWTIEKVGGKLYVRGAPQAGQVRSKTVVYSSPPPRSGTGFRRIPISDFVNVGAPFASDTMGLREGVELSK